MEFRQLRYFLAVAEHLHFSSAAERLGIAQPPLSQQIIKLERELGVKLFIRHPRRVELTEAGVLFKFRAQRILEDVESTLAQLKSVARGMSGHLSIGFAGSTVFHPQVAVMMRQFRKAYPEVLIKSEESHSTALLEEVLNARVDCAMVRLPLAFQGMDMFPLIEEDMLAVLPSGHRLERQRKIELGALAQDPFILFPRLIGPELYDTIVGACQAEGFSPRIEMTSPQISSSINMVAAGFGVTLIPSSLQQVHASGVSYHALKTTTLRTTIALVLRLREKSSAVLNFVRIAQAHRHGID